jgi:membrane protease YdiL (CAAX protease family)
MYAAIRQLWLRLVVDPLQWIDDNNEVPAGRLSPNARCTVVYVIAGLSLTMLSYAVLSSGVQHGVSGFALDTLATGAPELRESIRPYDRLSRNITWSLGCFTFYFLLPALIVRRVFGHRLRDYGLSLENFWKHLWIYVVMFIPVACLVWIVAKEPDFQRQYPFYKNPQGVLDFVIWEFFYALQFFSLEFFFRGFMLHGTKDRLGRFAIFAMVVPYTMIHFRKPLYETIGAVIAGSALGVLSLRTGSVLGGFLIHVAVAISMDVAALLMRT